MFRQSVHQTIHLTCLVLAAFLMPVSVWLLSAVSITCCVNWLIWGNFRSKIVRLMRDRRVLVLLTLFGMYLVWLVNTSDMAEAAHELKIKLPLLLFPVVLGSSGSYSRDKVYILLLSFVSGCIVATAAGFLALAGIGINVLSDSRDLARFVPSIRLSLLLNFAIFSALYLCLDRRTGGMVLRIMLAAAAAAMAFFLFRLLSVTGLIIFMALLTGTGLHMALRPGHRILGIGLTAAAAAAIGATLMVVSSAWINLHKSTNPEVNVPQDKTKAGNTYAHYPEETLIENGNLVWMNVCEEELRKEWNRRSTVNYDSTDYAGNEIRVTLIRYISFLGMTKDSAAVSVLSDADIANIERGFANPLYARPGNPASKAYELVWQVDRALSGANPSGHSLTQRIEYYRASFGIIRKNLLTGVGTGDVRQAFMEEYETNRTPLTKEYRKRSHNQYLTFAVTFGIPGMLLAILLILLPWIISSKRHNYLFVVFMAIIFMSMFNDDTFSSFTGTTFFSYFYTLFLMSENDL